MACIDIKTHSPNFPDSDAFVGLAKRCAWSVPFLGHSPNGRSIPIFEKPSSNSNAPVVLLTSGIHGDEPAGPLAVMQCIESAQFNPQCHWILSPFGNPDGLALGTRHNAEGVDINRDFKYTHTAEARFLKNAYAQLQRPDLHLSLHEDWEYPEGYLYEINSGTLPTFSTALLSCIETCVGLSDAPLLDGHKPSERGFICHESTPDEPEGWPEAIWLVQRFPLLSYTLETPSKQPLKRRLECHSSIIACSANQLLKQWKTRPTK